MLNNIDKDELGHVVMNHIQEKLKPGIYYISEFYVDGDLRGTTIREQGNNLADVENHIKPLIPSVASAIGFSGNVPITVDFYDTRGFGYKDKLNIYMEVETTKDLLIETIEESSDQLSRQGKTRMFTGNKGDIEEVEYGTYLYHDFTFLTDKSLFLKLLTETYKDDFVLLGEESTERKQARIHRDIKRKSNREGNITILGVDINSIQRPKVLEKNTVFLEIKYTYRLEFEGKFPSEISTTKIAIYTGELSNLETSFKNYIRGIKESLTNTAANETVGMFIVLGGDKVRYGQLKIKNELPHMNRVNYKKRRTVFFNNERSYGKYVKDVTRYIEEQHFKYKDEPKYLMAQERFKEATIESQQFNRMYSDIQGNLTIHLRNNYLLHIGTHYAILDNQLAEYKLLYNLFDERISIIEAKERVYKYGPPIQTYVEKVLDILDGRRTIEGPELDEVFGGRRV